MRLPDSEVLWQAHFRRRIASLLAVLIHLRSKRYYSPEPKIIIESHLRLHPIHLPQRHVPRAEPGYPALQAHRMAEEEESQVGQALPTTPLTSSVNPVTTGQRTNNDWLLQWTSNRVQECSTTLPLRRRLRPTPPTRLRKVMGDEIVRSGTTTLGNRRS